MCSPTQYSPNLEGVRIEPVYAGEGHGTGTDLLLSRSIIENHGGRLRVTRNSGPGITVSFSIPLFAAP